MDNNLDSNSFKYGSISITTIAKRAGMSACAVSRALNGRGTRFVNAYDISRAMGITLDELWERYYSGGKSRIKPFNRDTKAA